MTEKTFSQRLYDAGYAIPQYDISNDLECWRFRDEIYRFPVGLIKRIYLNEADLENIGGLRYFKSLPVAKIEEVKNVHEKLNT